MAGSLSLLPQEFYQLDQIGRPELKKHDTPLDFLRNESDRRGDDDELSLVETTLVNVSKATSDLRRFPQRLVEVLEVEDGGAMMRGDEVQSSTRSLSAGLGGFAIPTHPLREAPRPNGHRSGGK